MTFITQCLLPTRLIHFSVRYGKIVTSQCRQQSPIFICVGDLMHLVSLIFQHVLLRYSRNRTESNTGFRETNYNCHFSYTDSWCLDPFGSNISWDPKT